MDEKKQQQNQQARLESTYKKITFFFAKNVSLKIRGKGWMANGRTVGAPVAVFAFVHWTLPPGCIFITWRYQTPKTTRARFAHRPEALHRELYNQGVTLEKIPRYQEDLKK